MYVYPGRNCLSKSNSAVNDEVITKSLAGMWHGNCASLECVSLPNATWVRNPRHGWVTLKDLENILAEKEMAIVQREKEVHKREIELTSGQRALMERERRLQERIQDLRIELGQ